ncbi:MAG: transcription repressor NadR [Oscillospiraceae bacterium]|nr:transcription repressor NadR [Oscillospiraceae bacterium]
MTAEERRQAIVETLKNSSIPCNATVLAKKFGVSRQVVVADVALLRAAGVEIHATPRGYLLENVQAGEFIWRLACCHTAEDMETELNIMVDNGCTVLDVVIEHPVYGELTGTLRLQNRYDVKQFVMKSNETRPLSLLTEGIHLHTVSCPNQETLDRVRDELNRAGILLKS